MADNNIDGIQSEAPPAKRVRTENSEKEAPANMSSTTEAGANAGPAPSDQMDVTPSVAFEQPVATSPSLGQTGQTAEQVAAICEPQDTAMPQAPTAPEAEVQAASNELETNPAAVHHDSPSVTGALEAMLGGLDSPAPVEESQPAETEVDSHLATLGQLDTAPDVSIVNALVAGGASSLESLQREEQARILETQQLSMEGMVDRDGGEENPEGPEFEVDSDPYQSSDSDSDSDDSSSSDDSDSDDSVLLDPAEQARILMQIDDEDEDGGGGAHGGQPLRTKNEVPEVVIPKPDVTITPEMQITQLGEVEAIVENTVVIKGITSGEYRVLESGSVLCLADRSVVGAVSETIGRVQQPFYSVLFTNADAIKDAKIERNTMIYYSEQHSTYVFTQALKAFKGSDASNLHDEEVGDEDMEFSDDEKEAEYKRKIKQKKEERKNKRQQETGGGQRGPHPLRQQEAAYDPSKGISYDDEEEGPYKPLARPTGYGGGGGRGGSTQESSNFGAHRGGRGDYGGGRGRGDRGRGRGGDRSRGSGGDRGRGGRRGSDDHQRDGYSQPPRNYSPNTYSQPQAPPAAAPANGFHFSQPPHDAYNFPQNPFHPLLPPSATRPQDYQLLQSLLHAANGGLPHTAPPSNYPPMPLPGYNGTWNPQHLPSPPSQPQAPPGGAYLNPAFFPPPRPPQGQQVPQIPNYGQWHQGLPQTAPSPAQQYVNQPQQQNADPQQALRDALMRGLNGGAPPQ
jgi:H/ACA ribonucleoprotein complex non-core subunit NAF1